MGAFYKSSVAEFLKAGTTRLLHDLTCGVAGMGFDLKPDQLTSWQVQAQILVDALHHVVVREPSASRWSILLEYQLPGRPKRLDVVLLDSNGIIAIEFKVGADAYLSGDKWQLREYCWNLRDFHLESEGVPIAPILVATEAPNQPLPANTDFEDRHHIVARMLLANSNTFAESLLFAHANLAKFGSHPLEMVRWDSSQSHATRTVIEEAQSLFAAHDVREVNHAQADSTTEALESLAQITRKSRLEGLRSICFLTGVPGAGKTLVGLHAAYSSEVADAAGGQVCFASGNQPLLAVLSAALTQNRAKLPSLRREVSHELSAPVQNVHDFAIRHLKDPDERPPSVHVVVFDEAQRVWTSKKVKDGISKRVRRRLLNQEDAGRILQAGHSEPDLLLRVMERCPGWCCVIALVGGGQEIYDGEAGLRAWGDALAAAAKRWTIWSAPEALEGGVSLAGQTLFPEYIPPTLEVQRTQQMHLSVSKRSPRAGSYAEWVNHLLLGDWQAAARVAPNPTEFPVFLTRDQRDAKRLVREYAGEAHRYGLVASSGAMRLRADGVEVNREFRNSLKYPDWFLKPPGDIRSCNQLEVAASEFECQGLELDWTCVCWGGDFIWEPARDGWSVRYLYNGGKRGPHWRPEHHEAEQDFVRNKYRVLLTRARFGTVLYVPAGDRNDETRNPAEFDSIANFLVQCGVAVRQPNAI